MRGLDVRNLIPNVPAINQHDLNPGLELANPGIIEKVALLCEIAESCRGTISLTNGAA